MSQEYSCVIETITPEAATRYLATSPFNRIIKRHWVDELKRIIADDQFYLTHQGIAFNEAGQLRDGHHRLLAIAEGSKAVKLLVCRGIVDKSLVGVDNGRKRSFSDGVRFRGVECSTSVAATATVMALAPDIGGASAVRISQESLLAFIVRHNEAISYGRECLPRARRSSVVAGACARAWYYADVDRRDRMAEILRTGQANDKMPGDGSLIKVRDVILATKSHCSSALRRDTYLKVQNCIRAYLNGVDLMSVKARNEDFFPLPAEAA